MIEMLPTWPRFFAPGVFYYMLSYEITIFPALAAGNPHTVCVNISAFYVELGFIVFPIDQLLVGVINCSHIVYVRS